MSQNKPGPCMTRMPDFICMKSSLKNVTREKVSLFCLSVLALHPFCDCFHFLSSSSSFSSRFQPFFFSSGEKRRDSLEEEAQNEILRTWNPLSYFFFLRPLHPKHGLNGLTQERMGRRRKGKCSQKSLLPALHICSEVEEKKRKIFFFF